MSSISYLFTNAQGSVIAALTRSGGTGGIAASRLYTPYGGGRYSSGTFPTDYGYTGQRADSATGLDDYGARYYDPALGQFTSADTMLAGGLNRYAYVGGNPTTFIDPSGHELLSEEEPGNDGGQIDGSVQSGDGGVDGSGDGGGDGSVGSTGSIAIENTSTPPLVVQDGSQTITITDDTVTITDANGEITTMSLDDWQASLGEGEALDQPGSAYYQNEQQANAENPTTPTTPTTPQEPANPQDLVNQAENARTENGTTSHAAGAYTNLPDASGNPMSASSGAPTQSPAGIGDNSTCAECHLGQVITNSYPKGGLNGQTINVGVSQVNGRSPCPTCQGMFGELAGYTGASINVWWQLPGGIGIDGPMLFEP